MTNQLDAAQRGGGNRAAAGWKPVPAVDAKLGGAGDSWGGQEPCRGISLAVPQFPQRLCSGRVPQGHACCPVCTDQPGCGVRRVSHGQRLTPPQLLHHPQTGTRSRAGTRTGTGALVLAPGGGDEPQVGARGWVMTLAQVLKPWGRQPLLFLPPHDEGS